jgi:hypothetical protein
MFQQLVPLLRQRSVLLTVASLEDDQIRVNVTPKKLKWPSTLPASSLMPGGRTPSLKKQT